MAAILVPKMLSPNLTRGPNIILTTKSNILGALMAIDLILLIIMLKKIFRLGTPLNTSENAHFQDGRHVHTSYLMFMISQLLDQLENILLLSKLMFSAF